MGKDRHQATDDRHNVTDPYIDAAVWTKTITSKRVNELFKTSGGLAGHVTAIQLEVNRLNSDRNRAAKLEGTSGATVVSYINAIKTVRNALVASAKNAKFDFAKFGVKFAPLGSDLYLERVGGKLKVDGKLA
jgi:hypothetical protein